MKTLLLSFFVTACCVGCAAKQRHKTITTSYEDGLTLSNITITNEKGGLVKTYAVYRNAEGKEVLHGNFVEWEQKKRPGGVDTGRSKLYEHGVVVQEGTTMREY